MGPSAPLPNPLPQGERGFHLPLPSTLSISLPEGESILFSPLYGRRRGERAAGGAGGGCKRDISLLNFLKTILRGYMKKLLFILLLAATVAHAETYKWIG